jgi:hypothetical protein
VCLRHVEELFLVQNIKFWICCFLWCALARSPLQAGIQQQTQDQAIYATAYPNDAYLLLISNAALPDTLPITTTPQSSSHYRFTADDCRPACFSTAASGPGRKRARAQADKSHGECRCRLAWAIGRHAGAHLSALLRSAAPSPGAHRTCSGWCRQAPRSALAAIHTSVTACAPSHSDGAVNMQRVLVGHAEVVCPSAAQRLAPGQVQPQASGCGS